MGKNPRNTTDPNSGGACNISPWDRGQPGLVRGSTGSNQRWLMKPHGGNIVVLGNEECVKEKVQLDSGNPSSDEGVYISLNTKKET